MAKHQQKRTYCRIDKRYVSFCNLLSCEKFASCQPWRFDNTGNLIKRGKYFIYGWRTSTSMTAIKRR